MIHYVRIYIVSPEQASAFRLAWRHDIGVCRQLARTLQPHLLAVDLLHSLNSDSIWLSIEFWLDEAALLRSASLPARIGLNSKLHELCDSIIDLGAFTFLQPLEQHKQ